MILLRRATIYDNRTELHLQERDILIEKGVITKIAKNIKAPDKAKVISSNQLCVSPGWLDIGTYNGEQGYEYREDLNSLSKAAIKGGYTAIAPFPTGSPSIDNTGQLTFLMHRAKSQKIDILPIACLTKDRKGKEIAELIDLSESGAIAFSDGMGDHMDAPQLLRCLLYLKRVNGLVIRSASVPELSQMNEGKVSVQMGLEGSSKHLEISHVSDAIAQSTHSSGRLLVHNISVADHLMNIKKTDKRNISFTVSALNLTKDEEDVLSFDSNLKVIPPLRESSDRKALSKAITNGQLNVITSNHSPKSLEEKDQPFGMSDYGASTLETVFPSLNTLAENIPLDRIIHCLSVGPYEALGLEGPSIKKGAMANLTLFDPTEATYLKDKDLASKSKNNPFLYTALRGKVKGTIKGSTSVLS